MLLQPSGGAFPLDMEDAWGWHDGCALGCIHHDCIPCEALGAGTDLTSEAHPRAAIPRDH